MIEGRARKAGGRFVAIFALILRRDMIGVFPDGFGAIVTAETIAGHACMVIARGRETAGAVAVLAPVGALRVRRSLADRCLAIMARGARLAGAAMIEICHSPFLGRVAILAFRFSADMICGFSVCPHIIVAVGTALRRVLKIAVQMAIFARHGLMCACQRETGGKMVKLLV